VTIYLHIIMDNAQLKTLCLHKYINSLYLICLFCVGKVVHSYQYVLLQNLPHFFRSFKQWTVSRLFKGVKPFHGCLQLLKISLCQSVVTCVIVYAFTEIYENFQLLYLLGQICFNQLTPAA
jgi:hypothetical protein